MTALKTQDRYRKYNVVDSFEYILNEANPRFDRAVRLYELQVSIVLGIKLQKYQMREHERRDNWMRVSRAALIASRMVSRTRLLEHLIRINYHNVGQRMLLKKLARDQEGAGLLRKIITPNKSKVMAYSLSWRELNNLLIEEFNNQTKYSAIYHVSLNFALYGGLDSRCTWTRAASILNYKHDEIEYNIVKRYFKHLESASTAYKYKKNNGNHFAVFIWLNQFGSGFMRAIQPTAESFAETLLAKADDIAGLRTYLAQYAYVQSQLARQEYQVPELRFAVPVSPQAVSFDPLPHELIEVI